MPLKHCKIYSQTCFNWSVLSKSRKVLLLFTVNLTSINPLTPEFSEKNLQRIGHDHKNVIAGRYFNVDIVIHTFLKSIIIVDLNQFFPVDFSNYSMTLSPLISIFHCHTIFRSWQSLVFTTNVRKILVLSIFGFG